MSRSTRFTHIDDDPLLFEVPADWLVADTRTSSPKPDKPDEEGIGLFSLIERPERISRRWWAQERRGPRRVNLPAHRPRGTTHAA